MNHICSYSKVHALGHREVGDILNGPVVVEEKIDGSQFSFGVLDHRLQCRSKGQEIFLDNPPKMFGAAVETIKSIAGKLVPGWVYRAEYLSKPKHNVLAYSRIPKSHLILFDIMTGVQQYSQTKAEIAECLGLECVPTFFSGVLLTQDVRALDALEEQWLATDSILGGCKVEGVVIKNYAQFTSDGKLATAKIVSEQFKEVHRREWKVANPSQSDYVQSIIMSLRTEARWAKAVQHLRDSGVIKGEPEDIGKLLKEISTDVYSEQGDEIRDSLFKHFWPKIARGIISGFPEWYKKQLGLS